MVMSSMSGESCRHIERLKVVGVVICDPRVISLIAIGCGSSHRFHRKCIPLQGSLDLDGSSVRGDRPMNT